MTKFVFIVFGLLIFTMCATAQNDWKGSYTFDENGGKNAGGAVIFISHELNIFDDGDKLAATLQSNGYQTSSDLVCSVKTAGSKVMIYFQSYGENNMFEPYNAGDLLLTLEQKTDKGKSVILTYWAKFTPAVPKNEKTGKVYFEKSLDKK